MKCENFQALKEWQLIALRKHITDHQYYLGERGIVVDYSEAEMDFFHFHGDTVCHDLRLHFCNEKCPVTDCELRDLFNSKG
jgi:hypothetical protein